MKGINMADIHVGKTNSIGIGSGIAQLYYHAPINSPQTRVIPTPQSAIQGQV